MIKKTAAAAAVLFLTYTILILLFRPEGVFQNQWQSNVIKAQEYIYGPRVHRRVIVGSSLAAAAFTLNTPDGYFDLSFAGGSPLDGLEIIRRSGILPEYILVETNFYDRNSTLGIDKTVFAPLVTEARRLAPSLQERYQPVNIILLRLFDLMRAVKKVVAVPADTAAGESGHAPEIRAGGVRRRALPSLPPGMPAAQPSPAEKSRVKKKLGEMAGYIEYFSRRGVSVIFFEMPVHENAYFSPQAVYRRESVRKAFSGGQYFHLSAPDCRDFTYGDGAHLDQPGAEAYRRHFTGEAEKIFRAKRRSGGAPRGL